MSEPHTDAIERYGLDGALAPVGEGTADPDRDGHGADHANDHLASIYETPDEQFDVAVPFIGRGLERGEQCLYVADDNDREAVLDALRDGGIDVEDALESGALSVVTKAETYVRTDEFDPDAMLDFWRESLDSARDEEGFEGVRAAAEMTWALEEGTDPERLVAYETLLNELYDGDDYVVLCQYDRERFPDDVLSDVVRSHPFVVSDGTVCPNAYYRPPGEFFDADRPPLDVDRTVEALVGRARAAREARDRDDRLRDRLRQQEVVADLGQCALEARDLGGLLADVTERVIETLDADYCSVLELRGDDLLLREGAGWPDRHVGETAVGTDPDIQSGYTLREGGPVVVDDLRADSRFGGPVLLEDHGVISGISVRIGPADDPWGVLGVHDCEPRDFDEHDAAFVRSVANTVATAIERAERERFQRELYEITSDPDRSFEAKLRALFDLGCERFGLDLGGLARIDPGSDLFEVEYVSEGHDHLRPGARVALSETYCRVHVEDGSTTGITDPADCGFEGATAYEEFGVQSYIGTRVRVEGDLDRTFFFVSGEPRSRSFSEAERTFLRLMGEWVEQELERREYERKLEESNERLEQFAYAASHDLQEPLRMVSSYLQLIERRYAEELDEDGREFIDYAVDGADRMREMIEGLLAYSRVETQGDPLEPVELDDVLADVLADLQVPIRETDAEIEVGDLPRVEGDASQLRQVFQNLLDNAIEYSGDDPPRVRVGARREGSKWLVSVSDEGIGIDPEEADRVFEVFQRLHATDEHPGTGIGLALCRRVVERHGGDIWVDSEPGEGATVSFTLPAADG